MGILANGGMENHFYQEWDCIGVIIAIVVALLGVFWIVLKRDDSEAKTALLKIRSQIATMFTRTVVSEARYLIKLIEDNLPEALTRVERGSGEATRFDKFCAAIRKMSEEDFEEAGGKYRFIVLDTFSQILQQGVERLLDTADVNNQSINDRLRNPSGLSFSLEAETVLRLHFLADRTVKAERRDKWYRISRKYSPVTLLIAGVGGLSFLIPVFWIGGRWGCIWCHIALGILLLFGGAGLLLTLALVLCENQLKDRADECESDPLFERAFEVWKARGR